MSALQATTPRLSLFQIESELLGLIDQREDALERARAGEDVMEELAVVDGLIREYVKAEIKKVDNIAFAIKEFEARSAAKSQQAAELNAKANRDAETANRIKDFALAVLQDAGSNKEAGRLFTMTRQGNGGMQALTIAQPDLVPDHLRIVTIHMRGDDFKGVPKDTLKSMQVVANEPSNAPIRTILERAEAERKAILEHAAENDLPITDEVVAKKLNALSGVPGCRLEPRGEHLRLK